MANGNVDMVSAAKGLSRNPLGIIALFIVLVYGFASLVTLFGQALAGTERMILVVFLAVFPVLVLGVFAWLVSRHSNRLYAPADFKDEKNYVEMQLAAVASLASASVRKDGGEVTEAEVAQIVQTVQRVDSRREGRRTAIKPSILWVDDRPANNVYERRAFEAVGLEVVLSRTTADALERLASRQFSAIISDMGRAEGPREGYVLLDEVRRQGYSTPFFVYAGSNSPEHKAETRKRGGQGSTNRAQELFEMVTSAVFDGSN